MCAVTAAALIGLTGCGPSAAENARASAMAQLREQAAQIQRYASDSRLHTSTPAELLRIVKVNQPRVFATHAPHGMDAEWDAVLVATGSDGGGLSFEQVLLRACVRYHARLGSSDPVTWKATDCPASIDNVRSYGPYDETIRLKP